MKKSREQRAKKYNCDGRCYGEYIGSGWVGICGRINTCPETRKGELFWTVIAILTVILSPMIIIAFVVALFIDVL